MKQSIDAAFDDHPHDDEDQPPAWWIVNVADDCEGCADIRLEVVLEEKGEGNARVVAHLAPATARQLRSALATALTTLGESPD